MIEFHADDYGLFCCQSKRILEAVDDGVVNGLSVIVTGGQLEDCMELIGDREISLALHLDLVEGRALSETGARVFGLSYLSLLLLSYRPFQRKKYKGIIKSEIWKQIQRFMQYDSGSLRIDSHMHTHMIPLVFDALVEVIQEKNLQVAYIRFPNERLLGNLPGTARPINLVKVLLLNMLSHRNKCRHSAFVRNLEQKDFYGVLHSGNMNMDVVQNILKHRKRNCEILFHPGGCYEEEDLDMVHSDADRAFFSSENRNRERNVLKELRTVTEHVGTAGSQ